MGTDLKDLAMSYWRLEKWVANAPVDKKLAATSSLRNIKKYLDENNIVIIDPVGQQYDAGMAVDVVRNNMEEDDESTPIISETMKPIVMQNDSVIMFGQVIIGKEVKAAPALKSTAVEEKEPEEVKLTADEKKAESARESEPPKHNKWLKLCAVLVLLCLIISIGSFVTQIISFNRPQDNSSNDEYNAIVTQLNELKAEVTNAKDSNSSLYSEIETKIDSLLQKIGSLSNYDDTTIGEKLDAIIAEVEALKNAAENPEENEGVQFIRHVVVYGDTLSSICSKYGVSYSEVKKELMNINNITNENKIYVGQVIYIPQI